MSTTRATRRIRPAVGVGAALVLGLALTACGGDSGPGAGSAPATAVAAGAAAVPTAPLLATVGDLRVAAGYVPAPASPDVAAAYLTVVNTGTTADTLVGASSDASGSTTMHRTEGGAMVMMSDVAVPAGATIAFSPGADHLMLEKLTRSLVEGDRVSLTLQFQRAGDVTVTVPVTGYPTGGALPSEARTPLPTTVSP